jgi:integrase
MPTQKRNKSTGKMEWYGLIKHHGRQRTKKCRTEREAKAWEVAEWAKIEEANNDSSTIHSDFSADETPIPTLLEIATSHLEGDKGNKSQSTFNAKQLAFKRLFESINPLTQATQVTKVALRKHFDKVGREVSPNSANADLTAVNRLYNWAIKVDLIPDYNPCKTLEKLRYDKPNKYVPPLSDFLKVLNATDTLADRLMLTLFYVTLARHREVLSLRWEDVDFEKGTVTLWTGKRKGGRQADRIGIDGPVLEMLKEHLAATGLSGGGYVFFNARTRTKFDSRDDLLERLIKKAQVKRFTMHAIRHLAASNMAESGESLSVIQAMCRHKSTSTTDKYIRSLCGRTTSAILSRTASALFDITNAETNDAKGSPTAQNG